MDKPPKNIGNTDVQRKLEAALFQGGNAFLSTIKYNRLTDFGNLIFDTSPKKNSEMWRVVWSIFNWRDWNLYGAAEKKGRRAPHSSSPEKGRGTPLYHLSMHT
ncbi:hypothetical protein KP509_32G001800 [Ceratopteris richardii]|uniref:Uncharacterized protein n=1 Tax=Ceratopteris richardii TaxID=49495 RepID=A0A8T2QSM8_CERRI|nr:hypothetical protein KP509_32G001800 [Ceratopteris richardii]